MTREECAAALYDLIVIRGRHKGVAYGPLGSRLWEDQWEPIKEMWLDKADRFALDERVTFVEA